MYGIITFLAFLKRKNEPIPSKASMKSSRRKLHTPRASVLASNKIFIFSSLFSIFAFEELNPIWIRNTGKKTKRLNKNRTVNIHLERKREFFPLQSLSAPVTRKKHVCCLGGYVRRYGVVAVHYHRQGLAVIRLLIKRET
jgi:hypothetical protein